MTFAPTREIQIRRKGLLESGFDFGFESWSSARPGGLLSSLPVGAQQIIGAILGTPNTERAVVPPVVISEQPSTIYPGSSPRGQISKEINVPEGFHECVIQGVQRLCQDEPAGGWTPIDLPPIDEKQWGDIIRSPVPVPVDDVEENDMAIDWGTLISGVIDVAQGQQFGGAPVGMYTATGAAANQSFAPTPAKVTVDTRTGKVTKCGRRRRRRLLTDRDFDDLNRIATLPNNANVRTVLAKAIGRR